MPLAWAPSANHGSLMSEPAIVPIKRALLSVFDKTGMEDFAKELARLGVDLVSTGGTSKLIAGTGAQVRDISDLTGFPEMMDGRVKTLHPKVHGGLLAVRDNPTHRASMDEHQIGAIDLVVVNLYPFEATIAKNASYDETIENIEIGGQEPCLCHCRRRSPRLWPSARSAPSARGRAL